MNRLVATTGMAALGVVALQPAMAQDAKPWSLTASVRTFYDDNYTTLPSRAPAGSPTKRSSWGLDISPSGTYQFKRDQTTLDVSGRYGMRYYEDRREGSADHSLDFGVNLDHQFTEKQRLALSESFVIAQEPGLLDPSSAVSTALRTQGNNLRNNLQLKYAWDNIIERWSGETSYANTIYDYQQTGVASRSALLDRVENLLTVAGRYRIFDETETELLLGYSFGMTDSTSKDSLDGTNLPASRDSRSHYFFTGGGHKFTRDLKVNGRFGVQYVEYPNAATATPAFQKSQTSPYVDASGTWDYLPNSSAQLGVRLGRVTSDVITSVDAQTTAVYGSLNHEFVPDLKGSLLGQYQLSEYKQTVGVQNVSDNIFTVGVNLEWRFHQFISLEGGYNYDRQDADLDGRSYYRNRLYLGFKAAW